MIERVRRSGCAGVFVVRKKQLRANGLEAALPVDVKAARIEATATGKRMVSRVQSFIACGRICDTVAA